MRRTPRPPTPPFKITPLVLHVLLSLADAESHAYGIMKEIARRTHGRLEVGPGSLHFTLGRLLDAGLIEASGHRAGAGGADPRRRYYQLTASGRAVLREEVHALEEIVALARAKRLVPKR